MHTGSGFLKIRLSYNNGMATFESRVQGFMRWGFNPRDSYEI